MENKSNSLNRIKRQQREKVLRFSIRKYSFGAASVAVAALMFLGARVASADSVVPNAPQSPQPNAGVVNPKDKVDSPEGVAGSTANKPSENQALTNTVNSASTVDKTKLKKVVEELSSLLSTKLNLDESVVSPVKDRLQKGKEALESSELAQKDIDELVELLSKDVTVVSAAKETTEAQVDKKVEAQVDNTEKPAANLASQSSPEVSASEEGQTVSAKKDALKVSVDQLQAAVLEVPAHETTKEVLEKANEVMVLAQGVLKNTTVSLNDVEQMNKLVKRMFNSVKNATTRLNSGARDSRNGQRMAQGTGFRANGQINQGALTNIRYFASVDPSTNGGNPKKNDNPEFTRNKTDIKATYVKDHEGQWIVYDVYFNNDGRKMVDKSYQQHYYFQGPFNIMDLESNGGYKSNTVKDLTFTRYQNTGGRRLSDGGQGFTKYGNTAVITNPAYQQRRIFGSGDTFYDPNSGVTGNRNQPWEVFKHNQDEKDLNLLTKAKNGNYPGWSYYLGVDVHRDSIDYAMHMHVKIKLRDNVTPEEVATYGRVYAASVTKAPNTNQSYIVGAMGTRLQNEPEAKLYPIIGKEVTKEVGVPIENVENPVGSGFVTRDNGTKDFPGGMSWEWLNGQPNTNTAGVFNHGIKATYSDYTLNTTTATLKVIPHKPAIDQNSVNEKAGKAGQTVTVNVGNGVPKDSIVTLYNGNKVIGTGKTNGQTVTINVREALPSTGITAKTTVTNTYGTVESALSAPVTPTEVPDKAAPTVLINGKKLTENADDNRFIIYRGANFNPTFRVQDDKSNHVNLSITGLPNGVANVTTSGGKEFNYTIPDNTVANEAPFGESIASVVASDGRNSATYKFKYRIVDIQAKNSTTENRALGSELGDAHNHFQVAESNTVENDKYYPTGMQFKWIELNRSTITTTDVPNTTNLNELGNVTKYFATAVFPGVKNTKEIDRVNYTIYSPIQKVVQMTFNVTDTVKPTVKLVGDNGSDTTLSESTPDANLPKVTVYRGEKANVTIKASDNTGKIKELRGSGMPNGIWFNKNPNANSEVWLSSDNATETNPLSHTITGVVEKGNRIEEKIVTIKATDKTEPSNVTTVKFKVDVKEQKDKYTPTAGTTPVAVNNIGSISTSDLDKIKNSVSVPNLSPEAIQDGGVTKTLKNNGAVTTNNGKKYVTVEVTYPDRSKDEVPVEVQQNTNVVKRPIINLKQGETLSAEEMKTIVELQDGTNKLSLPADAVVTATFNTDTVRDGNWTDITVRFNDGTSKTVRANYNVKATFPVANTVYDFRGVTRTNDSESNYYINKGLPNGMNWFVKKGTETKPNAKIQTYLATDGLGKTDYTFGAYYAASRFNDNESNVNLKLKHEGTISHHVYDVMAATNRITVNYGATLTEANAKAAVTKVAGSEDLPTGTTYEWVNQDGTPLANKQVTEKGETTRYVKVTLPKTAEDGPVATQYRSSKIVTVTINESEKPKVSFNGSELSKDARNENSKFVIFRGATFNPTFTVSDNSGKVTEFKASGLPSGREFVKNTDTPNGNVQITGNDITATSNATLGDHIGKVLVKDASGNEQEYQFKYTVADVEVKNTPETVTLGTKLVDTANSSNGKDAHNYVKAVVESNSTGDDKYYPTNMSFKWSKDGNIVGNTTTFDTPGLVKYNAVADFYGAGGVYTKTIEGIGNNIKIYAPDKIEREVTFLVKPNPTVVKKEVPSPVRYEGDTSRDKDSDPVREEGTPGEDTITTTYTVDPKTGVITPTVGKPVRTKEPTETVVKVGTKPKVETTKDPEGRDVITTTTYKVNPKTGEVTPTTTTTYGSDKAQTVETREVPSPVRYEGDDSRDKDSDPVREEGTPGEDTITTTYTVDPKTGAITPTVGKPVRTKEPTETVVKVGTKPKVETTKDPEGRDVITTTTYKVNPKTGEVTPTTTTTYGPTKAPTVVKKEVPSPVRYEGDDSRDKDSDPVREEGTPGEDTITTTYTVDPKTGAITPTVGKPVRTKEPTETVVKVGTKPKVETTKDPEGRDVITTTTYKVNPKTGEVTPTTTTTYGPTKAPTVVKKEVPSPVRYEGDDSRDKDSDPVREEGTPGEDTITTTYTVDPKTGAITPTVGKPVRTKEPTETVVKVGTKPKVETTKDPEGRDVITTTTYKVNPKTGEVTPTTTTTYGPTKAPTVVKKEVPSPVRYEGDTSRDKDSDPVREEGTPGEDTITTTYTVDPKTGVITPTVGKPVRTKEPTETVVKVGTKPKVETTKDPEGRDVITTTTYKVNPKTGEVTPTTTTTYGSDKAQTVETREVPSPVRYEGDDSRDKDSDPVREEGTPGEDTITTTYTVDPKTGAITPTVGKPVRTKEPTETVVKVGTKPKVETTKDPEGRDVITTTTYKVNPKTGEVTPTTTTTYGPTKAPTVVKKEVPSPVRYEGDDSRDKDSDPVREEGTPGEDTITTTYTVDPKTGAITPTVGKPVRTKEPTETVVKVGTKPKVETTKDPEGRDVITTTTYKVNPKTGEVTPTTTTTYGSDKAQTVETREVPSPVRYEGDDSRDKDSDPVREEGTPGEDTITTTYTVDPKTGAITPTVGKPVRTKEPTETVVKVGTKPKVETTKDPEGRDVITTTTYKVNPKTGEVTPTTTTTYGPTKAPTVVKKEVPSPVRYEGDDSRDKDSDPVREEGTPGEDTITTTYTVDPKTGAITPTVGKPVRTKEPTETVVKVGTKPKVETTKDPEGRDVITTTTYKVNPKTGEVTPTTTTTYGPTKAPTVVKKEVPSPVRYEGDDSRDKDSDPVREEGTPGEDTITTTYTVDPKTGAITPTVGKPVRTKEPTETVVKVGTKPKVETTKDPEGRDVITTTTYKVNPKTGEVTPTTTTTYGPTKAPTVDVEQDPKTGEVTVTPQRPGGGTYPPGTTVEIPGKDGPITVTIGEDGKGKVPNSDLPEGKVSGPGKITEPNKPAVEVPKVETPSKVTPETPVTEKPGKIEITQQPNGNAIVTPKKPDGTTYPSGSKVVIPGENNTPITVTIGNDGSGEVPNDKLPKEAKPGTGTVTEPNKKPSQPVDVTTPARKTPTVDVEQDPKTGEVTVTPQRPGGGTYPPGTTVEIPGKDGPITVTIGEDGKGKVPNSDLPEGKVSGPGKITEPNKPAVEVPKVETPSKVTPETPVTEKPGKIEITQQPNGNAIVTPKKPDGTTYPSGSKVVIPGENNTPITVTIGNDGSGEVPNDKLPKEAKPGTGTVTEPNKKPSQPVDVTTPARKTPTVDVEQDPKTGEVTVTPQRPGGGTYPPGTTVEIPGKDGPITVTIGEDGKGKVPNSDLPEGKVSGPGKITEPNKPAVEVPKVETPSKVTPETPVTEKPGEIEITRKPNGNAIVTPKKPDGSTYPPGTKVEIPGENGTTITVTIGDNGSGEVPNDNLPKTNVPGTGTVTEPNKKPSQPVDVTTPARKTPTLDVKRVPETGDVIVTPKKPDGSTFPPGTKVEIPGENGPITVTIGENGSGKVPNDNLPKKDVPGTAKITEPGKPTVEVPNVTTPGKFTPETPVTEQPGEIEITRKPNGDAVVTPKKPDGSTYPPGTKVEIPGENGPITVTIGDNGSGEVPNDKLPKGNVPGKGTVTEPNKKPSQPVDVTTPARKTPTVELEQDPKTGDVIVTPKKPDGSTYPPGTKVEIPGKDGNPITVTIGEDGKGKVPNSELPDGKVPGTAKITEPGQPTVEVPDVTTPGKVTPSMPTDTNPVAPVTPDMPVKPDTNGDSGQDKPAPATPTPNADQVDNKTTNDNRAKSNDSQNVLPNTGTESNAALASLGLLGMLGGLGLALGKKKED